MRTARDVEPLVRTLSSDQSASAQVEPLEPRFRRARGQQRLSAALLAAPALCAVIVFLIAPLLFTIYAGFTSWSGLGAPKWVGTANYRELFQSGDVRAILTRTAEFVAIGSIGSLTLGVILAATVRNLRHGSSLLTALWFIPVITPVSAIAVFWLNALFPQTGAINVLLGYIGLGHSHAWLGRPDQALYVVSLVWVWTQSGFAFLISLNGMNSVPVSVYEAATVDGATKIRMLRSVTLPLIRPVLAVLLLLELVSSFNGFALIWGLTAGGPAGATTTVPVAVYTEAFQGLNFGYASAIATIGAAALTAVSLVLLRGTRSSSE